MTSKLLHTLDTTVPVYAAMVMLWCDEVGWEWTEVCDLIHRGLGGIPAPLSLWPGQYESLLATARALDLHL